MKKDKEQMERLGKQLKFTAQALATMGLSGALTLLAACAPQQSQPVVTEDDLTPPSTVQDVLAMTEDGGENYAYYWMAEDVEASMAQYKEEKERQLASYIENLRECSEEELRAELSATGCESREQAEEAMREWTERAIEESRWGLEAEHALHPAVSAQEAANRAGAAMEEAFGVDLSDQTLTVSCIEDIFQTGKRHVWWVDLPEEADGTLFSSASMNCHIDATTGEVLSAGYWPSSEEWEEMRGDTLPACFEPFDEYTEGIGRWNADDPSFAPMAERLKPCLTQALSGTALTGGAQVTDVRVEVVEQEANTNTLLLYADCDNGRTYQMLPPDRYDTIYTDTQARAFPLRSFNIYSDLYFTAKPPAA